MDQNLRQNFLDAIRAAESLSGAQVTAYDISGALHKLGILKSGWDGGLARHGCAFCEYIRDLAGGRILCIQHDREECLKRASFGQKPQWIRCPAGLEEMIIPLIFEEKMVALVFLGQVRISRRENTPALSQLRPMGADVEKLGALYQMLPLAEEKQMERCALLLQMALQSVLQQADLETLRLHLQDREYSLVHQVLQTQTPERVFTVKELAAMFYVTPEQLSRAFRRETGISLSEYIDNSRYHLACRLLREQRQSIATVAVNVGFQEQGAFHRWFRRRSGQTPQSYRNSQAAPAAWAAISPAQGKTRYVEKAQAHIQENFRSPLRVDALAARLGITPDHLNRLFRKKTGKSITEMLWDLRLTAAREELIHTAAPISHIARQTGFSSEGAFCKRFKQSTGMTPEEYRRGERR